MPTTANLTILSAIDLSNVTGGAGGLPLSGDVNQNIAPITNWGGNLTINQAPPAAPAPSPYRFEQLRQNPSLRFGPPPYKPTPVRR